MIIFNLLLNAATTGVKVRKFLPIRGFFGGNFKVHLPLPRSPSHPENRFKSPSTFSKAGCRFGGAAISTDGRTDHTKEGIRLTDDGCQKRSPCTKQKKVQFNAAMCSVSCCWCCLIIFAINGDDHRDRQPLLVAFRAGCSGGMMAVVRLNLFRVMEAY